LEEKVLVGSRIGPALVMALMFGGMGVYDLAFRTDASESERWFGAAMFALLCLPAFVVAVKRMRTPPRLRLRSEGFELLTLWGRRRLAWREIEPLFLREFRRRSRKYHRVGYLLTETADRSFWLREVEADGSGVLPSNFGLSPMQLMLIMNDYRDQALGVGKTG
jgi:hypothetical protein